MKASFSRPYTGRMSGRAMRGSASLRPEKLAISYRRRQAAVDIERVAIDEGRRVRGHRKTAAPISSSTSPQRPAGVRFSSQAENLGLSTSAWFISVPEVAGCDRIDLQTMFRPVAHMPLVGFLIAPLVRRIGPMSCSSPVRLHRTDVDDLALAVRAIICRVIALPGEGAANIGA